MNSFKTNEGIESLIPDSFKCAGFTIKIEIYDKLPDNDYGDFDDARNIIRLARSVEVDKETIQLTNEQIHNTLWHEIVHCFQFYYDNKYSESQAQIFANFMQEFLRTKTYSLIVDTVPLINESKVNA